MFHMFFGGVNSCSTCNLECVLGYKLYQLLVKLKEIIKEIDFGIISFKYIYSLLYHEGLDITQSLKISRPIENFPITVK